MKASVLLTGLAILLAAPSLLSAQHAGLRTAIGQRPPHIGIRRAPSPATLPHWTPRVTVAPWGLAASGTVPNNVGRHEPRTPSHPVAAPAVPGPDRERNTGFRNRNGNQRGRHQNTFIPYGTVPIIVVQVPQADPFERLRIGIPRNQVISLLGRPRTQIFTHNSETMIFSELTIIIENGVVALIR